MTAITRPATCTCECGCLVQTTQGWCYDCDKNCRNIPNTPLREQATLGRLKVSEHLIERFFEGCNCYECRKHSETLQGIHLRSAVDRHRFLKTALERSKRDSNPGRAFWTREAEVARKLVNHSLVTNNL